MNIVVFVCTLSLFYSNRAGNSLDGLFGAFAIAENACENEEECIEDSSDKPVLFAVQEEQEKLQKKQKKLQKPLLKRIQSNNSQAAAVEPTSTATVEPISLVPPFFRSIQNKTLVDNTLTEVSKRKQNALNDSRLAWQKQPRERLNQEAARAVKAQQERMDKWGVYPSNLATVNEEEDTQVVHQVKVIDPKQHQDPRKKTKTNQVRVSPLT